MLVGHSAVGLLAKRIEPRVSLGTWFIAVLLADLIFFPLLIAGIEHLDIVYIADSVIGRDDLVAAETNKIIGRDMFYSHSLVMLAVWGGLFAAAHFLWKRSPRAAWLLCAAVLSHWLLDFISHTPDMPLAPGVNKFFGLGLWNSLWATLIVEGGFWVFAIIVYLRNSRPKSLVGIFVFWIGVILLTIIWRANLTAGMDPEPVKAGFGGLISFSLLTAWAYWIDRLRPHKASLASKSSARV